MQELTYAQLTVIKDEFVISQYMIVDKKLNPIIETFGYLDGNKYSFSEKLKNGFGKIFRDQKINQ